MKLNMSTARGWGRKWRNWKIVCLYCKLPWSVVCACLHAYEILLEVGFIRLAYVAYDPVKTSGCEVFPKRALFFHRQCELKGLVPQPHHVSPVRRTVHVGTLRTVLISSWQGGRLEENLRGNVHLHSYQVPHVPPVCSGCSCVSCSTLCTS